jgi:hypothetical protein
VISHIKALRNWTSQHVKVYQDPLPDKIGNLIISWESPDFKILELPNGRQNLWQRHLQVYRLPPKMIENWQST